MAAGAILLSSALRSASGTAVLGQATATSMVTPTGGVPAAGSIAVGTPDVSRVRAMVAQLSVTAINTGTSLDVFFQSSVDGGTNWNDFAHFTTVVAATGLWTVTWNRDVLPTVGAGINKDATLAAATVNQGPVGADWRLKWVMVGTSYTFSVQARFLTASQ